MSIATIGSFVLGYCNGTGDYDEGTAVMLFYQIGEFFQSYAVGSSRKSIAALMDIRPDFANVEINGQIISTAPEEVEIGSITVIKPGERIPLDGIVEEGNSSIDTLSLIHISEPTRH